MNLTEEQQLIYKKAETFLSAAKYNFQGELYGTVLNRVYYAVFTCSQLMLLIDGHTTKTHSGNHNKFSEIFIKSGIVGKEYGMILHELFKLRQATDYDASSVASKEDAENALEKANAFFEMTSNWLHQLD